METTMLKQALEHDQAAKQALPGVPPEMLQTAVSIEMIGRQLDDKIALLAKTVALNLLDTARTCTMLSMQPTDQKVVQGPDGQQQIEVKPPRPEVSEKWMSIAAAALDLAHKADVLGDRPIARKTASKE